MAKRQRQRQRQQQQQQDSDPSTASHGRQTIGGSSGSSSSKERRDIGRSVLSKQFSDSNTGCLRFAGVVVDTCNTQSASSASSVSSNGSTVSARDNNSDNSLGCNNLFSGNFGAIFGAAFEQQQLQRHQAAQASTAAAATAAATAGDTSHRQTAPTEPPAKPKSLPSATAFRDRRSTDASSSQSSESKTVTNVSTPQWNIAGPNFASADIYTTARSGTGRPMAFPPTTKRYKPFKRRSKSASSQSADEMLLQELNNLSLKERQKVYEDIHGVEAVLVENPAFIRIKLEEFDTGMKKLLASKCYSFTLTTRNFSSKAKVAAVAGDAAAIAETSKGSSSPEFITKTYKVAKQDRIAYDMANFYSPRYVGNQHLKLMFLRCEEYDAGQAILRYMKFFALKLSVFGRDKIIKRITQRDVEEVCRRDPKRDSSTSTHVDPSADIIDYADMTSFLQRGFMQFLRQKDRSGRPVLVFFNKLCKYRSLKHLAATCYYVIMQHLYYSIEGQCRGIVAVGFENISVAESWTYMLGISLTTMYQEIFTALPIRFQAIHYCFDDIKVFPLMSMVKLYISKRGRVRFRQHFGSEQECRYQLMTFGIPTHDLPIDPSTSQVDLGPYREWLRQQRQHEKEYDSEEARMRNEYLGRNRDGVSEWVETPTRRDIVLGKGKPYQKHPGNLRLHSIVDENWNEYADHSRKDRSMLFDRVVDELRATGVRVLSKREAADGPEWEHVKDTKVREKVSHAFRNKPLVARYHSEKHNVDEERGSDEED